MAGKQISVSSRIFQDIIEYFPKNTITFDEFIEYLVEELDIPLMESDKLIIRILFASLNGEYVGITPDLNLEDLNRLAPGSSRIDEDLFNRFVELFGEHIT